MITRHFTFFKPVLNYFDTEHHIHLTKSCLKIELFIKTTTQKVSRSANDREPKNKIERKRKISFK
jgi:hypothetical protein